jgi:subtilisin family serine protease
VGALVRLPPGVSGADVGLREVAPGIGRLWGSPASLLAFADAHAELPVEVTPPLHPLLDTAGVFVGSVETTLAGNDGTGAAVGIADTGIDVTHPDFIDASGHTRIAWLLDLSSAPLGLHTDLEAQFGQTDDAGNVVLGAVWSAQDIDAARASGTGENAAGQAVALPGDPVGHGTLVASCAAGNGSGGTTPYRGVAPGATILVADITGAGTDAIASDDLLRGAAFLFDRADALGLPVVVNLSIGSDFGPHDGTMAWEQTLASSVGPTHPGHAIVAAAGNSGSIVETPIHENVYVSSGSTMRVPIPTSGAQNGGVQVWVAMRSQTDLRVGLDGPDETWLGPVGANDSAGKTTSDYNAGVYNGSGPSSPVPAQSHGAVVAWQGNWPAGTYYVTLVGTGTADLYVVGNGDASSPGLGAVGFQYGVRESTVNLPATSPSIIGVGCTINKSSWQSIDPMEMALDLAVPLLDAVGGAPALSLATRAANAGEPCWFSSAGPTLTGVAKPEIMAPGAAIVGALSSEAIPPAPQSIFTSDCPPDANGMPVATCQQIDAQHGVSAGTSFSSPLVAGAVAVLFQHDPTLTQDAIVAALQGGAHRLRGLAPFDDQAGAGELDVPGALGALDPASGAVTIPDPSQSWLTLGADTFLADGSTPLQATIELRAKLADASLIPADGFGGGRLRAYALIDGQNFGEWACSFQAPQGAPCWRRGPGVWVITLQPGAGLGGSSLTVGAMFDGSDIVAPKSLPIATDTWNGDYPPAVAGGCSTAERSLARSRGATVDRTATVLLTLALGLLVSRHGRRSKPSPTSSRRPLPPIPP